MININTDQILIPVDFSKTSKKAIRHGAFLAKLFKGELILLHVQKKNEMMDILLPALNLNGPALITQFLEKKLNELAQGVKHKYGVQVTPLVSVGNITSEIVNVAEEYEAGMIVMGTRGADSSNDLFLGSNAYRVLTKSDIPVMTVRTETPRLGYSKILLPLDSSEHSRQKVNMAIQFANKFASHIYVLGILGKSEEHYRYKMEVIFTQIHKMAKKKNLAFSSEIVKSNDRAKKTMQYAGKIKADLIITMTDQKTGPSRFILGTYDHQLINHSSIPVLSIPPETHEENIGQDSIGGMW